MNLRDMIINAVVEKYELINKRQAKEVVDTVFDTLIATIVNENKVSVSGLGTFVTKLRPERQGRNPQTQEPIKIPSRNVIVFKPSTTLKEKINNNEACINETCNKEEFNNNDVKAIDITGETNFQPM